MSNYKPSAKGVIDRKTVTPKPKRPKCNIFLFMFAMSIVFAFFGSIIFLCFRLAAFIVLGVWIVFVVTALLYWYVIVPKKSKNEPLPAYYLVPEKITGVSVYDETFTESCGRSNTIEVTYYHHTFSFENHKSNTVVIREGSGSVHIFPEMKNGDKIPGHMATVEMLAEGDDCFLLMAEGDEKIHGIFNARYYIPSTEDFVQKDGKYYLK